MTFISASGAHVSMPAFEIQEDILNIQRHVIQNIINCNEYLAILAFNILLLNEIFVSDGW